MTAYDCRDGAFDAVLLVKEPQTVRVYVDGRAVRRASFDATATWRLHIRPGEAAADGVCKLKIVPGGLLGSTRLSFER